MKGQTSGTYLASSIQIGPAPSGTLLPAIQLHDKSKHIRKLHENQKLCAIFRSDLSLLSCFFCFQGT